jgi:hypothetical protein
VGLSLILPFILSWYILIVSLIVLPLSWDVTMGCNMLLVGSAGAPRANMKGFGFFSTAVYDDETGLFLGCVDYSKLLKSETDDAGFKLGRAFGALLGASITLATFICLLVQCFNKHGKSCLWSFMKWLYVMAFACQGASFALWTTNLCQEFEGEESRCAVGSDGIIAIGNCILLFGMVIATFNSSPPRNPVFRCWYAMAEEEEDEEEFETDDSAVEEGTAGTESHKSKKSEKSQGKRASDEVSLFSTRSIRTLRSNGPRLTVKELARRLERKNIWPINQMKTNDRQTTTVTKPADDDHFDDPRVRTYYRSQRRVFSKFENEKPGKKAKSNDTVQTMQANSNDESTIESLKENDQSNAQAEAVTRDIETQGSEHVFTPSSFYKKFSSAHEEGIETRLAASFLQQIRQKHTPKESQGTTTRVDKEQEIKKLLEEEEEEEAISLKSGSTKSGSAKTASTKSASIKSGSIKSGSIKSGSIKSGSQKSFGTKNGSKVSTSKDSISSVQENESTGSSATAQSYLLEQLRRSVVLHKGGVRIHESRIGNTLKIVDEYPAPGDNGKNQKQRDDGTSSQKAAKSTASQIVKVRTEYCPEGRKTIMEETRPDGSCLVTTLIDPLTIE